jgi:hypothetical protein
MPGEDSTPTPGPAAELDLEDLVLPYVLWVDLVLPYVLWVDLGPAPPREGDTGAASSWALVQACGA